MDKYLEFIWLILCIILKVEFELDFVFLLYMLTLLLILFSYELIIESICR